MSSSFCPWASSLNPLKFANVTVHYWHTWNADAAVLPYPKRCINSINHSVYDVDHIYAIILAVPQFLHKPHISFDKNTEGNAYRWCMTEHTIMQAYCKCGESEDIYNASIIKNHTLLENLDVYAACIYLGIVTTYKRSVN
jgi:hypothetical protein